MSTNASLASMSNQTAPPPVHGFDPKFHPILITIAILVIISNMFVIVLFVTKETLRKGGKFLLLSLAISDITTGLITIPLNISCEVTYSLGVCMSSGILNRFLAISTVYHILAITFETYYAILRPMEHRVKIEKQKIFLIASAIWLSAFVIAVTPLTWSIGVLTDVEKKPGKDFVDKMLTYEIFATTFGFLLPLTLMVFAHARMFSKIVNALKLIRRQSSSPQTSFNTNKNKYKAALLFAVLLLVFIVCWLFWFVVSLINVLSEDRHPFPLWAMNIFFVVRYFTSFVNPLLYTFFRPDFYAAFKSVFCKRSKRAPSITLAYLLGSSHRTKRDSQTISTTLVRDQSVSSKFIERDTKV